jgi:DNA-binding CsgD family transcriptional regulator
MEVSKIQEMVELFNQNMSCYEIQKRLGISRNSVNYHLKKMGFDTSIRSTQRKDKLKNYTTEIVNLYLKGKSLKSISRQFGASTVNVRNILLKNNVTLREQKEYSVNKNYFDTIDTEEKAYFFGWLVTDGAVTGNCVRLKITDREVVENFKKALEYEGPIYIQQPKGTNKKVQYILAVVRKELAARLTKNGCMQNKTFQLTFPGEDIVPQYLMRHFLRGVLEGDGCIGVEKDRNRWRVSISGCTAFIEGMGIFLKQLFDLKYAITQHKNIVQFRLWDKHHIKTFLDYIYSDTSLYLTRKYLLYQNFLSSYGV